MNLKKLLMMNRVAETERAETNEENESRRTSEDVSEAEKVAAVAHPQAIRFGTMPAQGYLS